VKTLIAPLGHAPGTVTTAFYALQERGFGVMDRLITVTTSSRKAADAEQLIAEELKRWKESGGRVEYVRERIEAEDLDDLQYANATALFQGKIVEILHRERQQPDNEIYVSIAGGRKSMSALTAVAAVLYDADMIFHIYVNDDLERHGDVDNLLSSTTWRDRCLRPKPDEYHLALILLGPVNQLLYDYVSRHPKEFIALSDDTKTNYQAYHLEVKVAQFLQQHGAGGVKYERVLHHQKLAGVSGDIDVLAIGKERALVCECKLNQDERKALESKKVVQLRERLEAVRDHLKQNWEIENVEAWAVSNATAAEDNAKRLAAETGIRLMTAKLPHNWHTSPEWDIQSIEEMGG